MRNKETKKDAQSSTDKSKVGYQFTAIPTQLMCLCDVNVRSALFGLIQLSSEFAKTDGWFYRSNEDLQIDLKLSQHLVVATIDALYQKGIVSVRPQTKWTKGKKRPSNYYKVNYYKFNEYESIDFNSLRNPDLTIETMRYKEKGYKAQYISDFEKGEVQTYSHTSTPNHSELTEKVPSNIDYIDTIKTISVNKTIDKDTYTYRQSEEVDDIPFDIDEAKTETISEGEGNASNKLIDAISDSGEMQYTAEELRAVNQQAIGEWQMIDETRHQHIGNNHKEVNEWVGRTLSEGYSLLKTFRTLKNEEVISGYARQMNKLIDAMDKAVDAITPKQHEAFKKYVDAVNKAYDDKERYLERGKQIKKSKSQTAQQTEKPTVQQESEVIGKAATRSNSFTNNDTQGMAEPQPIQTDSSISNSPLDKGDKPITPPTPIPTQPNNDVLSNEELLAMMEDFEDGAEEPLIPYFNLCETTLRVEDMTDSEREYFFKGEWDLTDDGILNRYIKALKWLRDPKDADRVFETYQDRAAMIANCNPNQYQAYIDRWNKYFEESA